MGDPERQADDARPAVRKRRAVIASAVVAAVVGLVVLGLNTNRVLTGTTYDDVAAVPQVMDCLEGSGSGYHTIDAGGIRWYEARSLPASYSAPYGQFQQMDASFVRASAMDSTRGLTTSSMAIRRTLHAGLNAVAERT